MHSHKKTGHIADWTLSGKCLEVDYTWVVWRGTVVGEGDDVHIVGAVTPVTPLLQSDLKSPETLQPGPDRETDWCVLGRDWQ